jgi:hypothetical protein
LSCKPSVNQIIDRYMEGVGQPGEHIRRPPPLPGFELRQVGLADPGSVGHLLLGKPAVTSPDAQGIFTV